MSFRVTIFLLAILALTGCKRQNSLELPVTEKSKVIRLNFLVDDCKRYPAPSGVYPDKFTFSPIDPTNKVWIDAHELDLSTGEWTALNSKFGVPYTVQITENNLWTDSSTANVYISIFQHGLLEYNAKSKTFKTFELAAVSSFLAHKDFIFLGTPHGLFKYSRGADTIARVKNFPATTWVFNIKALSDDSLRLTTSDQDIIYRIRDSHLYTTARADYPRHDDDSGISRALPATAEYPYKVIKDDSLIWLHHQAGIYVKNGDNVYHVTQLDSGYLRQVSVDSRNLYLLFNHQFVVMNKQALLRSAERFDAESYRTELNAIYWLTSLENQSLQQMIFRVDSLQKLYENSAHLDIRKRVLDLDNMVGYAAFNDRIRVEMERYLQQGTLPEKFKKSAYINLIQYYTRKDNLGKTLEYYKKLRKNFPDYTDPILTCVIRVKTSIDSIGNLNLAGDKKFYFQTLEKEKLIHCGWFGESSIDDSIIANSYQQILNGYPNSEFADNAAFYLMEREYISEEGLFYSPEGIKAYERFIKKYPRSELNTNATLNIVEMYVNFSGEDEEHLKMLERVRKEILNLSVEGMTDTQKERYSAYRSRIDSQIALYRNKLKH